MTDRYDRDASEDAAVGAYIAMIDGDRIGHARELAHAVRAIGFATPLWALADAHRISDLAAHAVRARSRATSTWDSRLPPTTRNR